MLTCAGPDFFDAENYANITFSFRRLEGNPPKVEGDRFQVVGDLVIRDTTMEAVRCSSCDRRTEPSVAPGT